MKRRGDHVLPVHGQRDTGHHDLAVARPDAGAGWIDQAVDGGREVAAQETACPGRTPPRAVQLLVALRVALGADDVAEVEPRADHLLVGEAAAGQGVAASRGRRSRRGRVHGRPGSAGGCRQWTR